MEKNGLWKLKAACLFGWMKGRAEGEEEKSSLEYAFARCHSRWLNLFFGIIRCLYDKDPALCRGILKALEQEELRIAKTEQGDRVFAMNPDDEILKTSRRFLQHGKIPKLGRGKVKRTVSHRTILNHYSILREFLKDLPKKVREPEYKLKLLKARIEECSKIIDCYRIIPDIELYKLCTSPRTPREMVLGVIGKLYGRKPGGIDKLLDEARKEFPDSADA